MKIVNIVLGLAAAIILSALIVLGIKAFYPEPNAPEYPNVPVVQTPCVVNDIKCQTTQSVEDAARQAAYQVKWDAYQDSMKVYNKNVFIIGNVVGLLVFAIGFFLIYGAMLASHGVPIGIMLAGLWSIIYGYGRGWNSINDQLKFFVGLIVAVVVIGGSMWLIQRRDKMSAKKR